jgi:rhamnulokinase
VVSGCSHELAATLTGLPVAPDENWAFLRAGASSIMGTQVPEPIMNDISRDLQYINQPVLKGAVGFYKHIVGLWILEECQRHWRQSDRGLDFELLTHLAGSATAFESLINPADPRFLTPDDMPQKIQAFCKETNQTVPRKPGPIFRCILESLALSYRKTLQELEFLTGSSFTKLYLLGNPAHSLFNYFIANALQIPVAIAPPETGAIGNVLVQAVALGHLKTLEQGQAIIRSSFKTPVILPHANAWNDAYDRMMNLLK